MLRLQYPPQFNFTYSTNDFLGRGFTSQVYKGKSKITGFPLAIKIIDVNLLKQEDKKLVGSQIASMRKLRGKSPYLLNLIEVSQYGSNVFIVTEQCDYDLTRIIQNGAIIERNAIEIMQEIIKGYLCIASNGIVHRDLKPANILLKNNHVKIGDFGFAISLEECKTCHNVGSPLYMAPQCLLETYYSPKSDIWALGVIYFQMLFGHAPYTAQSQAELIHKLMNIPISDILRDKPMSEKSYIFLRKALALKLEDRMTLQELQTFSFKTPRPVSSIAFQKQIPLSGPNPQSVILSSPNILSKQQEKPKSLSDSEKLEISKALSSQLLLCEYFLELFKHLTPLINSGRNNISTMLQRFIVKIISKIKSTIKQKSFNITNIDQFWATPEFEGIFGSVISFELKFRESFDYNSSSQSDDQSYYKQLREEIMNTITALFLDNSKANSTLPSLDRKFLLDSLVTGYQLIRLTSVDDIIYFSKNSNISEVLEKIRLGPKTS